MATNGEILCPVSYDYSYHSPQVKPTSCFQWESQSAAAEAVLQCAAAAGIHGNNTRQLQWCMQSPASLHTCVEDGVDCELCMQHKPPLFDQFSYGCSAVNANINQQSYDTFSNPQSPVNTSPLSHLPYEFGSYSDLSSPLNCSSADCSYNSSPSISCCSSPVLSRSNLSTHVHRPDSISLFEEPQSRVTSQALKVEAKKPVYRSQMRNRQPRRDRLCFTPEQTQQLEESFEHKKYLSHSEREQLSSAVGVTASQVKTWYQNRRTKWKRNFKLQLPC